MALSAALIAACTSPRYACEEGATNRDCMCAEGERPASDGREVCVPETPASRAAPDASLPDARRAATDATMQDGREASVDIVDHASTDAALEADPDPDPSTCTPSTEVCNGEDDDCDQLIDEGVVCGAHSISAMGNYTCYAREYGTAYCWGQNTFGQLGDGTTEQRATPVPMLAKDVASIAAGVSHTCVIAKSGAVSCWGKKSVGQLGDGASFPAPGEPQFRATPAEVTLPSTARDIATGANHSCAILSDNRVFCWGANDGTFGAGPGPASSTPVEVRGLPSDVAMIVAGYNHTCALLFDRTVLCWGKNNLGQLGVGTTAQYDRPIAVPSLTNIVQLAADGNHTCALQLEGTVQCWGYTPWNDTLRTRPEPVPGINSAVRIAAGFDHDCAILGSGTTRCWGANGSGQLGDGTKQSSADARKVIGLPGPVELDLGSAHSCASTQDGPVECWGAGSEGELGDGSKLDAVAAIPALLPP